MYDLIKKEIEGKQITIYSSLNDHVPVVYLHTYTQIGKEILEACAKSSSKDFHLVCISGLQWDEELSPWPSDPVVSKDDHFIGQADAYCRFLVQTIVPWVERQIDDLITRRIIAGYSMGGLFSLYALYKTNIFSGAIVVSGSLWYPDFEVYALSHKFLKLPDFIYLSIGDKEKKTRNKALQKTEVIMKNLASFYREQGISTMFELNSGNHFKDVALRIAKGIIWSVKI